MNKKRWILFAATLLIAALLAAGGERLLGTYADGTVVEKKETALVALFPGANTSLVDCTYQNGILTPSSIDPQIHISGTNHQEISNVTVRFSSPLETDCIIQLFYDSGKGYSEQESIVVMAKTGDRSATLPLAQGRYYSVRVDINGTVPLDAIDCDGETVTTEVIPGPWNVKRMIGIFAVLALLLCAAVQCLTDGKWKEGAKTLWEAISGDAIRCAALSVVLNIFLSVYYHFSEMHELQDLLRVAFHPNWPGILLLFGIMYSSLYVSKKNGLDLFGFLHKWRWVIAGAVFVVAVFLQLSGSSLHQWNGLLFEDDYNGVLFGVSRPIRADEWARGIPLTKALSIEGYPFYSTLLRAAPTETVVTTGKLTWDFSAVFHPYSWGYLLLGFTYGLSFSWWSRIILLFMTAYDLFMLISKNRKLSAAFGVTVLFAPVVQWWFDTPITQLLIAVFGLILAGRKYLVTQSMKTKIACAVVVFILTGNYVLSMYPAWMVPLAYVILGLLIWVIITERKEIRLRAKVDIPIIAGTIILFAVSMAVIFLRSAPEIHDMMNTVYPGTTRVNWPISASHLYSNLLDMMSPFSNDFARGINVCEVSGMYILFPVGILLSIYAMIRRKKADSLSIILLALSGFFALFTFFDMPLFLRKITLMDMSMSSRIAPCFDFVQVFLLFRAVSLLQDRKKLRWWIALPVSLLAAGLINWKIWTTSYVHGYDYVFIGIAAISFLMVYSAVRAGEDKQGRSFFATMMFIVYLFSGGLVNPVQVGADEVEKSALLNEVREVVQDDKAGKWLVENLTYPYGMLPLMGGAPTINCANNYPNLELWYKLDPERDDEYYYNRFAVQITTNLVDAEASTFRAGDTADQFRLWLDVEDLPILEVSYIFSNQELEDYSTDSIRIEKIRTHGPFRIYHVTYAEGE